MPFVHQVITPNGTTEFGGVVASKEILDIITGGQVISIAYDSAGTSYVVGETFDFLIGSTVAGTPKPGLDGDIVCRGVVTAEAGGVPSEVKILSAGAYSTLPTGATATTTNASASGTGLVITFATQAAQWTEDRGISGATNPFVDDETDFEWICSSIKASNAPTVGLFSDTGGIDGAVLLMTASAFSSGASFGGQPGAPPTQKPYCSVAQSGTIDLYVSVTERRVNFTIRNGNNVQYGCIGLFIPFTDTDANYPFPGACMGQSTHINSNNESENRSGFAGAGNVGVVHPADNQSDGIGCYQYRDNLSPGWFGIGEDASDQRSLVWPAQFNDAFYSFTEAPQVSGRDTDTFQNGGAPYSGALKDDTNGWFALSAGGSAGVAGVAALGTGSRLSFTCQVHIISELTGDVQIIGIVDGYEAVHGIGLTSFEEIETVGRTKRFLIFPDTNTTNLSRWVAMEKI
jgi:hypothetical protein